MIRFELNDTDEKRLKKWLELHRDKFHSGAKDALISYRFTPTGIGTVIVVECRCGEEFDLTRYEEW